jgi:hypothetical protein
MAGGRVQVWALGADRFRITAPGHERELAGQDAAVQAAHELLDELD